MKMRAAVIALTLLVIIGVATSHGMYRPHESVLKPVVINVVGDVHGESQVQLSEISKLKSYFADGDLNIFNLETAITNHDIKEEKQYNFKAGLDLLGELKSAGFNLANIGNNHSYDYGFIGFQETLKNLDSAGIEYVGGGVNRASAYEGKIYTLHGLKIGVLGIAKVNGGPDSIATDSKPGVTDGYNAQATESAITELRKKVDVLIVVTHWGEEESFCPRDREVASAEKWQSLGADIIVGSHSHTIQPINFADNKLVAYSMGNFIFYSSKIETRRTGILKIIISPEKKISYKFEPFTINNLTKVPEPGQSELLKDDSAVADNKDSVFCK